MIIPTWVSASDDGGYGPGGTDVLFVVFFPVCGDVVNTAGSESFCSLLSVLPANPPSASFIPNEEGVRHQPYITAEESATGILKLVDKATRETHNGYFWSFNGSKLPW